MPRMTNTASPEKEKFFNLRIAESLIARIQEQATKEERSMASLVRRAVAAYLDSQDKPKR